MSTQTLSYIDAIEHLPAGGTLIFSDVPWCEYEQLLADLEDSNQFRIAYDSGRLEIMSPSSIHEMFKDLMLLIACATAESLNLPIETRGSTTFKQQSLEKGGEPDTCFYVQSAEAIVGKRKIDLRKDPPPDIVVEIDLTHDSERKLLIYASMGVPEVWQYDEQRARIYLLKAGKYEVVSASLSLPILTADALTEFLEQSKTAGQTRALKSFREWLRTQSR